MAEQHFSDEALDAGVSAWFGVTKVEAERNFIRDRMRAAVAAVLEQHGDQQRHPSEISAFVRLSKALGHRPGDTVDAYAGETVEAVLIRLAADRIAPPGAKPEAQGITDELAYQLTGYRPEQLDEREAALIRERAGERWAELLQCAHAAAKGGTS